MATITKNGVIAKNVKHLEKDIKRYINADCLIGYNEKYMFSVALKAPKYQL